MGIFEDYARKKEAERQGMYDDVTEYFSGQGLVPAAGRMAKEAIVSIPDAARAYETTLPKHTTQAARTY